MKRTFLAAAVIAVVGLFLVSCTSTNLETNQVGWSAYSATVAKDYDAIGIVSVTSTETITKSPFRLRTSTEGSRVLYGQLMDEARKLNADDIINVRIDRKLESSKGIFDFFTGRTEVYTYTATAVAIKYKDVTLGAGVRTIPDGGETNSVREAGPDSAASGLTNIINTVRGK